MVPMADKQYLVALTNQSHGRVDVHDIGKGVIDESSLVWSHQYDQPSIAGVKLRRYKGRKVVLTSYGHMSAAMIDYETHEQLYVTDHTGANPHSIELIPFDDGRYLIAVASTVGYDVKFFDPTEGRVPSVGCVYAPDGHGVLYDPDEKVLWILCGNYLSKNEVTWENGEVTVKCLAKYVAPSGGGHDLAPYYGDKNRLWVTFHRTVYQFDKTTGEFRTDYDAFPLIHSEGRNGQIKGIGNFDDGSCVKIYPDGKCHQWTSTSIRFMKKNKDGSFDKTAITSEMGHYYKIRVFCEDYN